MNKPSPIHATLQGFAAAVTDKMTQSTLGEPEEQAGKSVFSVVPTQVIKVSDIYYWRLRAD